MNHPVRMMIQGALCLAVLLSAISASAEGWKPPSAAKIKADTTKTLKKMDAGAKRLVRGTVDVITLRPLWDKKPAPAKPTNTWSGSTHPWPGASPRQPAPKKTSWWPFAKKTEPDPRPSRVEDFIGRERPR
ncbi:MAG: hypothetical protein JW818_23345 [Pirellulales bacterium]|nr:hypothetical protein [Pirellulales bacterium]